MRLFVYGSLKKGYSAHDRFISQWNPTFLGSVRTTPEYHIYQISWFPGMVIDNLVEGDGVEGEVYDIDEECLQAMDMYEGCSGNTGLFRREEITLQDGTKAIAYLYNQTFSSKNRIENGVWSED